MTTAWEINRRILMLDSHVDIPLNYATGECDPGTRNESLQVDLVKMSEGALDGVFLAAYTPQGPLTGEGYQAARRIAATRIEAVHRLCEQMYPDRIELAGTADEAERAVNQGKQFAVIGLENGYPVGNDLSMIRTYHDLGVRYITLCHNGHNQICDSCNPPNKYCPGDGELDETGSLLLKIIRQPLILAADPVKPKHGGLSRFGRAVVAEMNRLGIMVDLSHLGPDAVRDVLDVSKAPVIASHSSCRALCDRSRNLDDSQLLAIKANGGCVQITAVWGFLKLPDRQIEAVERLLLDLGVREMEPAALFQLAEEDTSAYRALMNNFQAGWKEIIERFPQSLYAGLAREELVNLLFHEYNKSILPKNSISELQ